MSLDPRLERSVLAEFALRHRQAKRLAALGENARALAGRLHRGGDEVAPVRRMASALPRWSRPGRPASRPPDQPSEP